MATQVFTPVFALASSAVHNIQHTVTDQYDGYPSTELAKSDSFNSGTILRCKELRADGAAGKVKAKQLIVSNRNAVSGGFLAFSNLYDGQADDLTFNQTDKFKNALCVVSGGAFLGGGVKTDGDMYATNFNGTHVGAVTGTTGTFSSTLGVTGLLTATGGVKTTSVDSGAASDVLLKRNGATIATIDSGGVSLPDQKYFKSTNYPFFVVRGNVDANITTTGIISTTNSFSLNVEYNSGNCFDASTGRFTPPVKGLYCFNWGAHSSGSTNANNSTLHVELKINGTSLTSYGYYLYHTAIASTSTEIVPVSGTFILRFDNAGSDYLEFNIPQNARGFYSKSMQMKGFLVAAMN